MRWEGKTREEGKERCHTWQRLWRSLEDEWNLSPRPVSARLPPNYHHRAILRLLIVLNSVQKLFLPLVTKSCCGDEGAIMSINLTQIDNWFYSTHGHGVMGET
jgi:hypothetical protein